MNDFNIFLNCVNVGFNTLSLFDAISEGYCLNALFVLFWANYFLLVKYLLINYLLFPNSCKTSTFCRIKPKYSPKYTLK